MKNCIWPGRQRVINNYTHGFCASLTKAEKQKVTGGKMPTYNLYVNFANIGTKAT
jgi:hypothetical protein